MRIAGKWIVSKRICDCQAASGYRTGFTNRRLFEPARGYQWLLEPGNRNWRWWKRRLLLGKWIKIPGNNGCFAVWQNVLDVGAFDEGDSRLSRTGRNELLSVSFHLRFHSTNHKSNSKIFLVYLFVSFQRNPGGTQTSPWCFVDIVINQSVEKVIELCDIPKCSDKMWLYVIAPFISFVLLIVITTSLMCCRKFRKNVSRDGITNIHNVRVHYIINISIDGQFTYRNQKFTVLIISDQCNRCWKEYIRQLTFEFTNWNGVAFDDDIKSGKWHWQQ